MTTNDSDLLVGRIGALDLRDKAGSTDNVKSSNTKEALRVVYTLGFEDLSEQLVRTMWDSKENDNHHTSAVIGTVEFTGLEIMRRLALGE